MRRSGPAKGDHNSDARHWVTRVVRVRPPERPRKRITSTRDRDQVHVIIHQAIGPDRQLVLLAVLFEEIEIKPASARIVEYDLPSITPLGDMVRYSFENYACDSGHQDECADSNGDLSWRVSECTVPVCGDGFGDYFAVETAVLDEDFVGVSSGHDDTRKVHALAFAF